MGQLVLDVWVNKEFTLFVAFWLWVTAMMVPRQLMAVWFYYQINRDRLFMRHKLEKRSVTAVVTIYQESPDVLRKALTGLKRSLQSGTTNHAIVVIIDGFDLFREEGEESARIARECGADLILTTNARSKRQNLRNMIKRAAAGNLLYEFIAFMDSDTILETEDVILELCRPFADPRIGGVTTAQRCISVETRAERVSDWLEHARLLASMAAGSLYGQVGCLPGRLYMVRTSIVEPWIDSLVEDYWSVPRLTLAFPFIRFERVQCFAGDDRVITNRVLSEGYKTVMTPYARVRTVMPTTIWMLLKTWLRWGRSSQWYSIIAAFQHGWFWRNLYVAYQYIGDLTITLITVFLVGRWLYLIPFGDDDGPFSLLALIAFSFLGMLATFVLRQAWHLKEHPRDFWFLPTFVMVVTAGQFVRLLSLLTPGSIGKWGTRAGADQSKQREIWVRPYDPS